MDFKSRTPDIQQVFNKTWSANDYNQNGVRQKIEESNNQFNKMFNIKTTDDKRREMLQANSVDGRLKNLQDSMSSLQNYNHNNFK